MNLANYLETSLNDSSELQEILVILQSQTDSVASLNTSEDFRLVNDKCDAIQGTLQEVVDSSQRRNEITEDQIQQIVDNAVEKIVLDLDEKIAETREINIQESKNQKQYYSKTLYIVMGVQSLFFLVALVVTGTWMVSHLTDQITNPRPQQSSPSLVD